MKKIIAYVCIVMLCLQTSCTFTKNTDNNNLYKILDPKNPVTVTLWHYYSGENQRVLEEAILEFNRTIGIDRGIIVDPVDIGSIAQLEEAVTYSAKGIINSEPMPEMFSSYSDKAIEIDSLGMICNLDGYFSAEEKSRFVESFLRDGTGDDNRLMIVPVAKSTELLFVNADGWNEFSKDTGFSVANLATWEGILESARNYYNWADKKTPGVPWNGTGMLGFDSVANYIISGSRQLGVEIIDAYNKQAVLSEEVLRRIFDIYCTGIGFGYFDAIGKFRTDDIKAGDIISYVGSSVSGSYFPAWVERNNKQIPIDLLPLPYPFFEGGEEYAIQQGAGICVSKSTPEKQAGSIVFLKWFTSTEQNTQFSMSSGYLPVINESYASEKFDRALKNLEAGSQANKNTAKVYKIALNQVLDSATYAPRPFEGSYDVRTLLQSTLVDIGQEIKVAVDELKKTHYTEEEILKELEMDEYFSRWIKEITNELDRMNIGYSYFKGNEARGIAW